MKRANGTGKGKERRKNKKKWGKREKQWEKIPSIHKNQEELREGGRLQGRAKSSKETMERRQTQEGCTGGPKTGSLARRQTQEGCTGGPKTGSDLYIVSPGAEWHGILTLPLGSLCRSPSSSSTPSLLCCQYTARRKRCIKLCGLWVHSTQLSFTDMSMSEWNNKWVTVTTSQGHLRMKFKQVA